MLFNSIEFGIFLPVVFGLYWLIPNGRINLRNTFLIIASYFFYGWWDVRFLSLIIVSSGVDYLVGTGLNRTADLSLRRLLLWISIAVNLGLLGFFKYYNFFLESFAQAFRFIGHPIGISGLDIILPVGISFYTFQTMSYTIDLYRKNIEATEDPIQFFAFVSFFPQLVAGPIERAKNLLPQFRQEKRFCYDTGVDGMRQMLWGFFKKLVISDNCAKYADLAFMPGTDHTGSTLLLGAVFFTIQIYCDFSGYSDIAIGCARLFGFDLTRNFATPYFSRDIGEFWRRWHISLSSWFKDYVYIPLGGSRVSRIKKIRNIFAVFLLSGFWHGANWTFLAWGALNALYFLPLLLRGKNRVHMDIASQGRVLPRPGDLFMMLQTFMLTVMGWVFFRADSMAHAVAYFSGMFSPSLFSTPQFFPKGLILIILVFFGVEWLQREKLHGLAIDYSWIKRPLRLAIYYGVVVLIYSYGGIDRTFIYFQF